MDGASDITGRTPTLTVGGDGMACITLNRPRHLNRLHTEDLLALQAHFSQVREDVSVRVLVIAATGRAFCAGFHLGQLGDAPQANPQLFEHTVDALEALPLPTIARLNGGVYGGATDLALACDFRVGVQGMELRMPAARLGLHYYASGLRRAVSRLGPGAAKRLFLLAETVPDHALMAMGYLDHCVPADALDAQVQALAGALAAGAPLAVRGMKQTLDDMARGHGNEAAWRQRETDCAASDDLREGLAAIRERRLPRFEGR